VVLQLLIGSLLTVAGIAVSGLGLWAAEVAFTRWRRWLRSPPHHLRTLWVVLGGSLLVLATITAGVWLWAGAFLLLGVFPTVEEALYFAMVAYTTLGLGDVVPPERWRILGAMAAANGFLNIGLLTTLLIEGLGQVRVGYRRTVHGDEAED
jgi:polyferredoxin